MFHSIYFYLDDPVIFRNFERRNRCTTFSPLQLVDVEEPLCEARKLESVLRNSTF